jgi:hypothetical protein
VFVGADLVSGEDVSSGFFVGVAAVCVQLAANETMMISMRRRKTISFFMAVFLRGRAFSPPDGIDFRIYFRKV